MGSEANPEPSFDQLLENVAAARDQGASMEQMLQLAADQLSQAPEGADDPQRRLLLDQLQQLQPHAGLVGSLAAAEEPGQAFGALLQMQAALEAARPQGERDAQRDSFLAKLAAAREEGERRAAEHARERVARGLSEQAGTGVPLPWVLLAESLVEDEHDLPLGASRIGGVPDLPPGVSWPALDGKRIPFLAQIDLAELAAAQETVLPKGGWLYAFGLFDCEEEHWPGPVRIFCADVPRAELVRIAPPEEDEIWPDGAGERVYELVPLAVRRGAAGFTGGDGRPEESAGWLFGEMDGSFGTPGEIADAAMLEGDDWINFLAIESVGSMEWSDAGHLYLLARRSDLEALDFARTYGAVCSS